MCACQRPSLIINWIVQLNDLLKEDRHILQIYNVNKIYTKATVNTFLYINDHIYYHSDNSTLKSNDVLKFIFILVFEMFFLKCWSTFLQTQINMIQYNKQMGSKLKHKSIILMLSFPPKMKASFGSWFKSQNVDTHRNIGFSVLSSWFN